MEENENLGKDEGEKKLEVEPAVEEKPVVETSPVASVKTETKAEPQRPKVELPKINMPHLRFPKMSEIPGKIKSKLREYWRVLKITKKPDSKEYKAIVKASGIGITIIGVVGFIIHMIVQLIMLLK